jgi:Protein of unknown function (DUF3102)
MAIEDRGGHHLPVPLVSGTPDLADRQFNRGFDYGALPSGTANVLRERGIQIRRAVKKTAEAIIAIGRDLIAAKKILGYGRFVDWVETECGFRIRTAQNYMAITRLSAKYAFVAYLPVRVVLRLAHTRRRLEFLEKISANIGSERHLTEDEICALLEKFKKMRQLDPGRQRGRRPARLKPIEKPSAKYCDLTKTEYARLNAEHMEKTWGFLGLLFFRDMVNTDTVAETLQFVLPKIRHMEFERGLGDLRRAANQE